MKKIVGIIPSRYASTRFPAKALADIGGKTMIQRVYEQATKCHALAKVVVATDHEAIAQNVISFGGYVCMTHENHQSGTDRCFEALQQLGEHFDYVINIQGDEPFINPKQIVQLVELLDGNTQLATLIKRIEHEDELFDHHIVKVIKNHNQEAIYFSRTALPYYRNAEKHQWLSKHAYYKHIGIYAYRTDILKQITSLPPSGLEMAESLEQLRWIENGYTIHAGETAYSSMGIDTPADLERLKLFLKY